MLQLAHHLGGPLLGELLASLGARFTAQLVAGMGPSTTQQLVHGMGPGATAELVGVHLGPRLTADVVEEMGAEVGTDVWGWAGVTAKRPSN